MNRLPVSPAFNRVVLVIVTQAIGRLLPCRHDRNPVVRKNAKLGIKLGIARARDLKKRIAAVAAN